jgi:hypothetical protein
MKQGGHDLAISTLRTTSQRAAAASILATLVLLAPASLSGAAQAAPLLPAALARTQDNQIIQVRGVFVGGGRVSVAPRSAAVVRSGTVVRTGPVVRGGTVVRSGAVVTGPRGNVAAVGRTTVVAPGRWSRPGWYRWPRGGAMAAGAAIGYLAAASAVAYGPPPEPGMCWYYTNVSHTRGFWDYCP